MNTDRIRRAAKGARERWGVDVRLTPSEAEALCDLADGARRWINAAERMDINEVARAEAAIRAALARLDGEDTG